MSAFFNEILYACHPYCQWGLFSTFKLNEDWIAQAGASAGNDVTPRAKHVLYHPERTV
jgi:hypothetical protein